MRRVFSRILFLVLLPLCFLLPCQGSAHDVLKIGGVGSPLAVMRLVAAAFEKSHPSIRVRVLPSLGSTGAYRALSRDAIDIGLAAREPKAEERGIGIRVSQFAQSPFIFVTHRNVRISNISLDEIIRIYKDEITTWPDGKRLRTPLRPSSDTDTHIVKRICPELARALEFAEGRPGMTFETTDQDMAEAMEKVPGAFGFTTLTQVIAEKRQVNILSYNGIAPTTRNLANGSYPLSKKFFIVTRGRPSMTVQKFLDFMGTPRTKRILEKNGNIVTKR